MSIVNSKTSPTPGLVKIKSRPSFKGVKAKSRTSTNESETESRSRPKTIKTFSKLSLYFKEVASFMPRAND